MLEANEAMNKLRYTRLRSGAHTDGRAPSTCP